MIRIFLALAIFAAAAIYQDRPPELPDHAKINGQAWKILRVDHLKSGQVATTNCDDHTIKLLSTIARARDVADALWHELMHALDDCNDAAWNNTGDDNDPEDGHIGIYTMTPRILDLLVDNPELIRFIQYEASK